MSDFPWQAIPTIDTPRLQMRALDAGDTADLFTIYRDAEVMRYTADLPFADESVVAEMLASVARYFAAREVLVWGIVSRATNRVIGTCDLHSFTAEGTAEVGCVLGRAHWGQGLMREALTAIIAFGFAQFGVQRMLADIDGDNVRSRALFARLGFVPVPQTETFFAFTRPAQA